jgi:photosystem II stability/assembly factor-like uncharacterized protein
MEFEMKNIKSIILVCILTVSIHSLLFSNPLWEEKNAPTQNSQYFTYLYNFNNNLYMLDDQSVYISTNYGESWYTNNSTLILGTQDLAAKDSIVFAAVASSRPVAKSTDYGYSWQKYTDGIGDSSLFFGGSIAIKDDYVFFGWSGIYRSKISESTPWEMKNNFIYSVQNPSLFVSTMLVVDNKILLGMGGEGFFISTDDGESWHERNNGLSFKAVYRLQYFEGYLYASTFGGGVCRTNDWGENWVRITPADSLALRRVNAVYVDGNTILAGTDFGGIYISRDFSATWEPELVSHLQGINGRITSFLRLGNYLFAGVTKYGVLRTEYSNLFNSVQDIKISDINVFPNPAKSTITLELKEEFSGKITAVDLIGNEKLIWEGFSTVNNLQLDVSGLITGQYILTLDNGKKKEFVKFIKQ